MPELSEPTTVYQVTATFSEGQGDVVRVTRLFDFLPTIMGVVDFIREAGESISKTSETVWDNIDGNAGERFAKLAERYLALANVIETEMEWPDDVGEYRVTRLRYSVAPKSVNAGCSTSITLTLKTLQLWGSR
jgi:hypothetical protein